MVVTIVVIVGIIGIGVGVLAYRSRTEKGIESGISSFRRELHALAPRPDLEHRSSGPERTPDPARGMTIMPNESDQPAEPDALATETEVETDDAAPAPRPSDDPTAGDSGERPDA